MQGAIVWYFFWRYKTWIEQKLPIRHEFDKMASRTKKCSMTKTHDLPMSPSTPSVFLKVEKVMRLSVMLRLSIPIWTYSNLYEPIWTYLNLSEPIQINPNLSKPIQTYPNMYEPIWTYTNLFKRIHTYLNPSKFILPILKLIRTYLNLSKTIQTYPNISKLFWSDLKLS